MCDIINKETKEIIKKNYICYECNKEIRNEKGINRGR